MKTPAEEKVPLLLVVPAGAVQARFAQALAPRFTVHTVGAVEQLSQALSIEPEVCVVSLDMTSDGGKTVRERVEAAVTRAQLPIGVKSAELLSYPDDGERFARYVQ